MSLTAGPGVPAALKSAMNGPQDTKPFTYLPGGLDFSEIRSPKMAKRLAKHNSHTNGDARVRTKGCRIFLGTIHVPKREKCTKSPQNIPKSLERYQMGV
jgi:hypothetical protein